MNTIRTSGRNTDPQVGTPTLRSESAPAGLERPLTRVRLGQEVRLG